MTISPGTRLGPYEVEAPCGCEAAGCAGGSPQPKSRLPGGKSKGACLPARQAQRGICC